MVAVADLAIDSFTVVAPPTELLVGQSANVTLRKAVSNAGPSSPMDVRADADGVGVPGASVSPARQSTNVLAARGGLATDRRGDGDGDVPRGQLALVLVHEHDRAAQTGRHRPEPREQHGECRVLAHLRRAGDDQHQAGSDPNSVNPNQGGQSVAVAILTTAAGEYGNPLAFDATTVDPLSVRFGPAALVNGGGWDRDPRTGPPRGLARARRENAGRRHRPRAPLRRRPARASCPA